MSYEKQTWKQYDDDKTEEQNIQDGAVVTSDRMNHIEEGLETHSTDKTNPHGVNKTQVGLDKVDNIQQAPKSEFDTHVANKNNPHSVTKSQVGLGNVDNVQQAPLTDFNTHKNDKTNPHSVTKAQTGLGSVDNYSTATQSEAELGTSSIRFMTPLRVFQAIAKWTSGKFMELTGNQTVAGTKNFSSQPSFNGALLMPLDSKGVVRYKMNSSNSTNIASGGVDIIRFGDLIIINGLCSLNKAVSKDMDVFGNYIPNEIVPTQDLFQAVFQCSWGGSHTGNATEIRNIYTRYGRSYFSADQPISAVWINVWGSYQIGKGDTPSYDSSSLITKR